MLFITKLVGKLTFIPWFSYEKQFITETELNVTDDLPFEYSTPAVKPVKFVREEFVTSIELFWFKYKKPASTFNDDISVLVAVEFTI